MEMEKDKDDIAECNMPYKAQVWLLRPIFWIGICVVILFALYLISPLLKGTSVILDKVGSTLKTISPVEVKWKWWGKDE
uniref:Uncharacterized protein n=1 Tax=Mimivirus LCMiAC01 TaxID=2506608 RepID=A0A481Z147_9VIRU|nr:MAG: hypothetical protein LCMiAC01_01910 [Mimivirus LCMiAC01]